MSQYGASTSKHFADRSARPVSQLSQKPGQSTSSETIEERTAREYLSLKDDITALEGVSDREKQLRVIEDTVHTADMLFENIKGTKKTPNVGLILMDAEVLECSAAQMKHVADNVGEENFNLDEWAEAFARKAVPTGDEAPIRALASAAEPFICKTLPSGWSQLLGGFELSSEEIPEPKKNQRRTKTEPEAEKKQPEKVVNVDGDDEVRIKVTQVYVKLKRYYKANGRKPINFFRFVVDPTCFTKTSLNIFHVSFLVHDDFALLEPYEDSLVISPISRKNHASKEKSAESKARSSSIMSISWDDWEKLIKKFKIESAMI